MHKEILNQQQIDVLPIIKTFKEDFGLVGGTAIALHLGHRKSIDFDLFTNKKFENDVIVKKLMAQTTIESTIVDQLDQLTVIVNKVKLTFLYYPFALDFSEDFEGYIKMPDLLNLASMKAYTLGRRSKWKDYIDLYYIFKQYSLKDVSEKAEQVFKNAFNEKLFREQLCYFDDIDFSEHIDYASEVQISDEEIKNCLIGIGLSKSRTE
jgi:hypothetical protein